MGEKQRALAEKVCKLLKESTEKKGVPVVLINSYGTDFHRVFWIGVPTDKERDKLNRSIFFKKGLFRKIKKSGYLNDIKEHFGDQVNFTDKSFYKHLHIVIESQETVDRDFAGNWRYRYQT